MNILLIAVFVIIYLIFDTIYLDYINFKKSAAKSINSIDDAISEKQNIIRDKISGLINPFACKKCSHTTADSDVIQLASKEMSQVTAKKPHKFIKITCKICGFCEYYNLNAMLGQDHFDPVPLELEKYGLYFSIQDSFTCLCCSKKKSDMKSVYVKRRGLSRLINFLPNELIAVSCKNCFYTIFFNDEIISGQNIQISPVNIRATKAL